ncbi:MAG: SpoIIE family protein phosphatase [Clostridiales bacterium]|nr:SpoIIE family protein phosphatase [Clostridiales bacterium]
MKKYGRSLFKYAVFFGMFAALYRAKSILSLEPASIGLFSALVYSGQNILVLSPLYFLAAFLTYGFSPFALAAALPPLVFYPLYYIYYKLKRKPSLLSVCLCSLVCRLPSAFLALGCTAAFPDGTTVFLSGGADVFSIIGNAVFSADNAANLVKTALSLILSVLFSYAFAPLASAILKRGAKNPKTDFTADERAALGLLAAIFFLGIYGADIIGARVLFYASALFFIAAAGRLFNGSGAFFISSAAGIGAAFFDADLTPLAYLTIAAAVACAVRPLSARLSGLAAGLSIPILSVVLSGFSAFNFAAGLGALAGAAAAFALSKKLSAIFSANSPETEKNRPADRDFVNDSRLAASRKMEGLRRAFSEMTSLILKLSEGAAADDKRIIMAAQFGGVADIFKKLSEEASVNLSLNAGAERRVADALAAENIACLGVAVYGSDSDVRVSVIVPKRDINRPTLVPAVERALRRGLSAVRADTPYKDAAAIEFKAANRFEVVYGEAHRPFGRISGDVKSAFKAGGEKFIAALADGMGHGESARRIGENAISLIENFYLAGFTDETVLYLVNHALCGVNGGAFTALDICVIDLAKGSADFIKMGAHDGYIRRKNSTEIIKSRSLPMGAVEGARPVSDQKFLMPDDLAVIVSDGVGGAFADDGLRLLIASSKTKNPQDLADLIMREALKNDPRDDMSVLVIRIYEKRAV